MHGFDRELYIMSRGIFIGLFFTRFIFQCNARAHASLQSNAFLSTRSMQAWRTFYVSMYVKGKGNIRMQVEPVLLLLRVWVTKCVVSYGHGYELFWCWKPSNNVRPKSAQIDLNILGIRGNSKSGMENGKIFFLSFWSTGPSSID